MVYGAQSAARALGLWKPMQLVDNWDMKELVPTQVFPVCSKYPSQRVPLIKQRLLH